MTVKDLIQELIKVDDLNSDIYFVGPHECLEFVKVDDESYGVEIVLKRF